MSGMEFRLSAEGLRQAADVEVKDFTFIVGRTEYKCNRFQACFFSRRVARLVQTDKTVDHFVIEHEDRDKCFKDVMALMNGGSIRVTPSNVALLEFCARELENDELGGMIADLLTSSEETTASNIIEHMRLKASLGRNCRQELDLIAGSFETMDVDFALHLTLDELESILQSEHLVLPSMDDFFDLIDGLIGRRDESYKCLLRYVDIRQLSYDRLAAFLRHVSPSNLCESQWEVLNEYVLAACGSGAKPCQRSGVGGCEALEVGDRRMVRRPIVFESESIFETMKEMYTDMPITLGELKSVPATVWGMSPSIGLNPTRCRLCLKGYRLMPGNIENCGFCVSWVIEGKDSSGNWEIIDLKSTEALSEPGKWKTFECDKQNEMFYADIRIRQLENSMGYDALSLGGIDIIGKWEQLVNDCSYQGKPFGGILSFISRENEKYGASSSASFPSNMKVTISNSLNRNPVQQRQWGLFGWNPERSSRQAAQSAGFSSGWGSSGSAWGCGSVSSGGGWGSSSSNQHGGSASDTDLSGRIFVCFPRMVNITHYTMKATVRNMPTSWALCDENTTLDSRSNEQFQFNEAKTFEIANPHQRFTSILTFKVTKSCQIPEIEFFGKIAAFSIHSCASSGWHR